jgi:hypothetical protein
MGRESAGFFGMRIQSAWDFCSWDLFSLGMLEDPCWYHVFSSQKNQSSSCRLGTVELLDGPLCTQMKLW